jgi:hypothetical protein
MVAASLLDLHAVGGGGDRPLALGDAAMSAVAMARPARSV